MSETPFSLLAAFRATHYRVYLDDTIITLRIGRFSGPLALLHARCMVSSSAFLTAFNPCATLCGVDANRTAQGLLSSRIDAMGLSRLDGVACDPDRKWPDEPSLLVLGITRDQACALAREFRQRAIVFTDERALPALVFL